MLEILEFPLPTRKRMSWPLSVVIFVIVVTTTVIVTGTVAASDDDFTPGGSGNIQVMLVLQGLEFPC